MLRKIRFYIYALVLISYYIWLLLSPALFSNAAYKSSNDVAVTGHRGAAFYAPENTISSIRKGIELGADRIEIDIHQTKDSRIVVLHDDDVDRTTNGSGLVSQLNYDQIRELDAGSKFAPEFKGEKIPSLEEVLQEVNGQCDLVIEFKNGNDHYPNIEENTIALIKEYHAESWCIVHSFNTEVLERLHHKMPQLRLHKLLILDLRFTPFIVSQGIELFDPEEYPYIEEYSINEYFGNSAILKELHLLNKKVNIWTVNKASRIQAYRNMGVDGIISDDPALIQ